MKDQVEGAANKVVGATKNAVGREVGNEDLAAEGTLQEVKGHVQTALGDAKDAMVNAVDKAREVIHEKTK